jgi:hypothetical protein
MALDQKIYVAKADLLMGLMAGLDKEHPQWR